MSKFGLIGYPVEHSKSPELFRKAYGGKWPYEIINEPSFEKALQEFISDFDYQAINVTSPFKMEAAQAATVKSPEVQQCGAANILVKIDDGVGGLHAYNSDYFAVRSLLDATDGDVAVVGFGGAGKAAYWAARSLGKKVRVLHHDELEEPLKEDIIVYTLPKAAPGYENMQCRVLLEANYKDPTCKNLPGVDWYIPGENWLVAQAASGWRIMTGEEPDF